MALTDVRPEFTCQYRETKKSAPTVGYVLYQTYLAACRQGRFFDQSVNRIWQRRASSPNRSAHAILTLY